jgi:hypothetical protein
MKDEPQAVIPHQTMADGLQAVMPHRVRVDGLREQDSEQRGEPPQGSKEQLEGLFLTLELPEKMLMRLPVERMHLVPVLPQ